MRSISATGMRSLFVLAVLLGSSLARAQAPGMTPPVETTPQPQQNVEKKNPSIAVLLSLGVPVAGAIVIGASDTDGARTLGAAALYFGPSTGQWYAGKVGGLGLGLRAVGAVSMVYGLVKVLDSENECDFDYDGSCQAGAAQRRHDQDVGSVLMLTGAGLWVGSSIYDIVLAKRAADSWNARHGVMLTPGLVGTSDKKTPGLFVNARF
jgi:hypothetical protein